MQITLDKFGVTSLTERVLGGRIENDTKFVIFCLLEIDVDPYYEKYKLASI